MKIIQKDSFMKAAKKLKLNQRRDLEEAIIEIVKDVEIGKAKIQNLGGVRVHKFKMVGQLTLIVYTCEEEVLTLTLLAFGSHQNFYRDLKR